MVARELLNSIEIFKLSCNGLSNDTKPDVKDVIPPPGAFGILN